MEESDEVPLLTRDVVEDELFSGNFKVFHQVWASDQNEEQDSDFEEDNFPRASSVKSGLSQAPDMECSQSQILSQGSEPRDERKKLSREEAYQLLKEATTAADAAQRALEHICGEDFKDATGEELEARDNLVTKVQKRLTKLQQETRRRSWHVKDPNKTFLSTSACEDFGVKIVKSEATAAEPEKRERRNEKGTQTESCPVESKEVQTENESKSRCRPFRKPFDQLKVIRLKYLDLCSVIHWIFIHLCD